MGKVVRILKFIFKQTPIGRVYRIANTAWKVSTWLYDNLVDTTTELQTSHFRGPGIMEFNRGYRQ